MKYPKHRTTIYLTVRVDDVVVGAFRTAERAQEFAEASSQEMLDKTGMHVVYDVKAVTYYDE